MHIKNTPQKLQTLSTGLINTGPLDTTPPEPAGKVYKVSKAWQQFWLLLASRQQVIPSLLGALSREKVQVMSEFLKHRFRLGLNSLQQFFLRTHEPESMKLIFRGSGDPETWCTLARRGGTEQTQH
jgi:hypothetical protein